MPMWKLFLYNFLLKQEIIILFACFLFNFLTNFMIVFVLNEQLLIIEVVNDF